MMNLDDTIKAFQCCIQKPPDCANCPEQGPGLGIECRNDVKASVLLWLKAQEPRVMTLEELVRDNVVYLEDFDKESTVPGIYCDGHNGERAFATKMNGYLFVKDDDYGVRWRCWTSRPTDAQREAVKWE